MRGKLAEADRAARRWRSRRRDCRAIRRPSSGTSSTAPSSRSPSATWTSPSTTAQESVDLSQRSRRRLHLGLGGRAARRRPARNRATSTRGRAAPRLGRRRGAGAHPRRLEGLLPRTAHALLARARTATTRPSARPLARRPGPRPSQLPLAAAWADRAAAAVALHDGDPASRRRAGADLGRCRRRGRRSDRGSAVAHARGPRTRPSRQSATAPSRNFSARPRSFDACGALRYRDEAERELRKLGHRIHRRTRPGKTDASRPRVAHRTRTPDRAARRRPQDEPPDRRRALPQPEDGRDPPAQHLRKMDVPSRVALARAVERAERTPSARPS